MVLLVEDAIDGEECLFGDDGFMNAFDDIALQEVVRHQATVKGIAEDTGHGIATDGQAHFPDPPSDFFRSHGRIVHLEVKGFADQRRFFRVVDDISIVPFITKRNTSTPMTLAELGHGSIDTSFATDIVFHLGIEKLHILHGGAEWIGGVDRHGSRFDEDASLFEFFLGDNGFAAFS